MCLSAVCSRHITVIHGFEHRSRLFAKRSRFSTHGFLYKGFFRKLRPFPRLCMAAISLNCTRSSVYYTGNLLRTRTIAQYCTACTALHCACAMPHLLAIAQYCATTWQFCYKRPVGCGHSILVVLVRVCVSLRSSLLQEVSFVSLTC